MMISTQEKLKKLYEIDDSLWLEKIINLLKENRLNELDLDNLIEELESLGKRDKLAVSSLLEQIMRHLLLIEFWENEYDRNYRHWKAEITGFRNQLNKGLTTNLKNFLIHSLDEIYQDALEYVETKSNLNIFPLQCPYTIEQLLDKNWFPER